MNGLASIAAFAAKVNLMRGTSARETTAEHWASGAIHRAPDSGDYAGLSYKQASMRAVAICQEAVVTGRTMNAEMHLKHLHRVMAQSR